MSSSEPVDFTPLRGTRKSGGERFHLQVRAQQRTGATSGDTRITVRNGWDELVSEGYGQIALDLERGLYTLRLERGGATVSGSQDHAQRSSTRPGRLAARSHHSHHP